MWTALTSCKAQLRQSNTFVLVPGLSLLICYILLFILMAITISFLLGYIFPWFFSVLSFSSVKIYDFLEFRSAPVIALVAKGVVAVVKGLLTQGSYAL